MRRAAIEVDVPAVGIVPEQVHVEPKLGEQPGATVVVAPLAVSTTILNRPRRCGSGNARRACARYASATSSFATRLGRCRHRPSVRRDDRFHFALQRLGELLTVPREHLDAVVLKRIVGSGNDDARVEGHLARHVGDRRRRHDTGTRDGRTDRPRTASELLLDPFSRLASIPADDEAQRPDVGTHRTDQRRANARNCGVIERIFARSPADAVCTEEMRHDRDISIGLYCGKP